MLIHSLISIIETAIADSNVKNATGNIRFEETPELLKKENLQILEDNFNGVFCFVSFNSLIDRPIADYVRSGAISEDSGRNILILFFLDKTAFRPQTLSHNAFEKWIDLDQEANPSHSLTLNLFAGQAPPKMPGMLFVDKLSDVTEPIFVSLEGIVSLEDAALKARRIFQLATESYINTLVEEDNEFVKRFAVLLAKDNIKYQRAKSTSVNEALIKSFNYAKQHIGEIVSFIKLVK